MNPQPKPVRIEDEAYKEFIRRRPCLLWTVQNVSCAGELDAHHVREKGKGGIGTKPSDRRTVPLCRKHHAEYHAKGKAQFEADHALILEYEIQRLQQAYKRLPKPRLKKERSVQPKIRRIEVTCNRCTQRSHSLPPSKLQGKTFRCPVTNQMVKVA